MATESCRCAMFVIILHTWRTGYVPSANCGLALAIQLFLCALVRTLRQYSPSAGYLQSAKARWSKRKARQTGEHMPLSKRWVIENHAGAAVLFAGGAIAWSACYHRNSLRIYTRSMRTRNKRMKQHSLQEGAEPSRQVKAGHACCESFLTLQCPPG